MPVSEARMKSIVIAFTSAAALAFLAGVANAECFDAHKNVTASADDAKQIVAMSSATEPVLQPAAEEITVKADTAQPVCSGEEKDCAPATE